MFSKSMQASISRLVISSFLFFNIHSTAVAVDILQQEAFIRQQVPQYIIETVMAPTQEQHKRAVAALRVLQYVDGVYKTAQFFNFLAATANAPQAPKSPELSEDDFDVSDSETEDLEDVLQKQHVYTGHAEGLGAFVVAEDGSMVFRGDGSERVDSIAFNTEKNLVLDHLNAKKAILSAASAVLRDSANIEDLTLQLGGTDEAGFQIAETGVLKTKEVAIRGGHFCNAGEIAFAEESTFTIDSGALYNQGNIHSEGRLAVKADSLLGAIGSTLNAAQLAITAHNVFNKGRVQADQLTAVAAGVFDNAGTIAAHDSADIEALAYNQTGSLQAPTAVLSADKLTLQGVYAVSDLRLTSDEEVKALSPISAQKIEFLGRGKLVNVAGLRADTALSVRMAEVENRAPLLSKGDMALAGHITNYATIASEGRATVAAGSTVQNGDADTHDASMVFGAVSFDSALTNFRVFTAHEAQGTLHALALQAGSRFAIASADLRVGEFTHAGAFAIASGEVRLEQPSTLQTDLLEIAEHTTLRAQDLTLKAPQQPWHHEGVIHAKTLTVAGEALTVQGNGTIRVQDLITHCTSLTNDGVTFEVAKQWSGTVQSLTNEGAFEAPVSVLPNLASVQNGAAGALRLTHVRWTHLSEFANSGLFENAGAPADAENGPEAPGPEESQLVIQGLFKNTGFFQARNVNLAARRIESTKRFRLLGTSSLHVTDEGVLTAGLDGEHLTFFGTKLTTKGKIVISHAFTAPTLTAFSNDSEVCIGAFSAARLEELCVRSWQTSSFEAGNLKRLVSTGTFVDQSALLGLPALQTFETQTFEAQRVDFPSVVRFQNAESFRLLSDQQSYLRVAGAFADTKKLEGHVKIEADSFVQSAKSVWALKGVSALIARASQAACTIKGILDGDSLTIQAPSVQIAKGTSVSAQTLSLNGTTQLVSDGTLRLGTLVAPQLATVKNAGKVQIAAFSTGLPIQTLENTGTWESGACVLKALQKFHNSGTFSAGSSGSSSVVTAHSFKNTGDWSVEGAITAVDFENAGTMSVPGTSSVSVTGEFVQKASLLGNALTVTAIIHNEIPATAIYSATQSLTLNLKAASLAVPTIVNKGKILSKNVTYTGPALRNDGTLEGTEHSTIISTGGFTNTGKAILQNLVLKMRTLRPLSNSGELKIEGTANLGNYRLSNTGTLILNTNAQALRSFYNAGKAHLGGDYLGVRLGTTRAEVGRAYSIGGVFETTEDSVTFYQGAHVIASDFNCTGVMECNGTLHLFQDGAVTNWGHIRATGGVDWEIEKTDVVRALEKISVEKGTLRVQTSSPVHFDKELLIEVPLSLKTPADVTVSKPLAAPKIDIECGSFSGKDLIQSTSAPMTITTTRNLTFGNYVALERYAGKTARRESRGKWEHRWRPTEHSGSRTHYSYSWTTYSYSNNASAYYKQRDKAALYAPYGLTLTARQGSIDLSYGQTYSRRHLRISAPSGSISGEGVRIDHIGNATFESSQCTVKKILPMEENVRRYREYCNWEYKRGVFPWSSGRWVPWSGTVEDGKYTAYFQLGDDSVITIKGNLDVRSNKSIVVDGAQFYVEGYVSFYGGSPVRNMAEALRSNFFTLGQTPGLPSVLSVGQTITIAADSGVISANITARNVSLQFAAGLQLGGARAAPPPRTGPYCGSLPQALGALKEVFRRDRGNASAALNPIHAPEADPDVQALTECAQKVSKQRKLRQHYGPSVYTMTLPIMLPQVIGSARGFRADFLQKLYRNGIRAMQMGLSLPDLMNWGESAVFLAPAVTDWGEQVLEPHLFVPAKEREAIEAPGIYAEESVEAEVGEDLKVSGYTIQAEGPVQIRVHGNYTHTPRTRTELKNFHGSHVTTTVVSQASLFRGESLVISVDGAFTSYGGDRYQAGAGGLHIHSGKDMTITPRTETYATTVTQKQGKKTTTTRFSEERQISQTQFEAIGPSDLTSGQNLRAQAFTASFAGDLTLGGADKTNVSATVLYDQMDEFSRTKRSWGRHTDTSSYQERAHFLKSVVRAGGKLIVIGAAAAFSGSDIHAKVISNQAQRLTFEHQKAEQKARSSEKRSGVFSTETRTAYGKQEVMLPTTVAAQIIESDVPGGTLTVLNSLLEADLLRLKGTNFEATTEPLKNTMEVTETTSGLFSKPISSPISLPQFQSTQVSDLLAGTAQTASAALGVMSDINDMLHATNPFSLLATPLDHMLSVTIGTTKRKTFSTQMRDPGVSVKTQVMVMENDSVKLKGEIQAQSASIKTKYFVLENMQDTAEQQITESSCGINLNPLSLRKGFVGLLPGISRSSAQGSVSALTPKPSTFAVNQLYLNVDGDVLISGSQVIAQTVDALVSGNLTIQSVVNAFEETHTSESWSTSLSGIKGWFVPGFNFRSEDKKVIRQKLEAMAEFFGIERFVLHVGNKLLQRSAAIGLRADGVTAGETPQEIIQAAEHVHEKIDEVDLSQTTVVNMFGGTALTLAGQLGRTPRLLKDMKEMLQSAGKAPAEIAEAQRGVKELFRDDEFMEIYTEFDADMQEIARQKQAIEAQKAQTRSPEAAVLAANGTPPSSPTGLPEAPDLAAPEGPDFAQAVALADLETREENLARDALLKLNGWQKQVALWAEKHPEPALRLRQTLDVLIHAGGLYAFTQAGIIGAEMGAILGPYGSAFGAIGMMALVYGGGEAFAAGLDAGLGWLAQKAGTLGRTASEAEALVQTVKTTGEVALTAMALTGLKKGVRAVKKPATTAAIKDALSERAVVKDGKVFLGERELGAVPQGRREGKAEAINKKPYNPREMEAMLKKSGEEVTSTTLPPPSAKNVKLAGQRHPETGIVFDQRGFPIYDDVAKVEVRITGDLANMRPEAHMRAATRQLRDDIGAGRINQDFFSEAEYLDIKKGKEKIGDYTWHHHQDSGRMQLVPDEIHAATGHVGGNDLWGMQK